MSASLCRENSRKHNVVKSGDHHLLGEVWPQCFSLTFLWSRCRAKTEMLLQLPPSALKYCPFHKEEVAFNSNKRARKLVFFPVVENLLQALRQF